MLTRGCKRRDGSCKWRETGCKQRINCQKYCCSNCCSNCCSHWSTPPPLKKYVSSKSSNPPKFKRIRCFSEFRKRELTEFCGRLGEFCEKTQWVQFLVSKLEERETVQCIPHSFVRQCFWESSRSWAFRIVPDCRKTKTHVGSFSERFGSDLGAPPGHTCKSDLWPVTLIWGGGGNSNHFAKNQPNHISSVLQ